MISKRMKTALRRGICGYCPACGQGKLYTRYLKVASLCNSCNHDLAQYPADDAPPYLTIALVGHVAIPLILWFESVHVHSLTTSFVISLVGIAVVTLLTLPFVKGLVLGYMWALQMRKKRD